jgi:quercetin dioxygenase-like cupin family protein
MLDSTGYAGLFLANKQFWREQMRPENFFNINDMEAGIKRQLAPGITTTVYTGDQAMVSVARLEPNTKGTLHHHPQEQWGICLDGSGTRFQGDLEVVVVKGDFWRTPGNMPHTIESGPDGLLVLDVFAPPRREYEKQGSGFASAEEG